MIDEKYLSEIKEFHEGDWIVWIGGVPAKPKVVLENWSNGMDFILDGKPHKVKNVENSLLTIPRRASFFDAPRPDMAFFWGENLHHMRKVDPKKILKDLME